MCLRPHARRDAHMACALAISATLAIAMAGEPANAAATLEHAPYGTTQAGQAVEIFTLTNDRGLIVRFLSYGGVITEIRAPDRTGRTDNIVLGLRNLHDYETLSAHYGAITGRYANRIGNAQFTLDGQTYHLIANNGVNSLHGGPNALDKQVWDVAATQVQNGVAATLSHVSKDGDQNFPGTLTTHVTYTLTNDNALRIDYLATTDKHTVINFTNHSYFNLAGNGSGSVADQMLLVNADRYTPSGADLIPTGEIVPVEGTPLDFRQMMPIGARLNSAFQQMVNARGYDHNFVLNQRPGETITFAARAYDPRTGRVIDCFTTEPGLQVYTSNGLNGSVVGSSGTTYRQTEAFTLETQHYPDSPNKPNFPTTELQPGQEFRSTTIFRFATDAPLPPLPPPLAPPPAR
jgi:aldose 1-epimerase